MSYDLMTPGRGVVTIDRSPPLTRHPHRDSEDPADVKLREQHRRAFENGTEASQWQAKQTATEASDRGKESAPGYQAEMQTTGRGPAPRFVDPAEIIRAYAAKRFSES